MEGQTDLISVNKGGDICAFLVPLSMTSTRRDDRLPLPGKKCNTSWPPLQVILLSDGSVTRHLKLMTNLDVKVVSRLLLVMDGDSWQNELMEVCNISWAREPSDGRGTPQACLSTSIAHLTMSAEKWQAVQSDFEANQS